MNAPVPTFEEKATDCYCTPDHVLDRVRGESGLWGGVDWDPFHDPEDAVDADEYYDIRRGEDAYTIDWREDLWKGARAFVNGPYSGGNPSRTADLCRDMYLFGVELQNLCPAAPGSTYWRRSIWPLRPAVAWLGRLSYRAGRTIRNKDGKVTAKKGQIVHGNRTEIAMVYLGPDRLRFQALWESAGYVVTVQR